MMTLLSAPETLSNASQAYRYIVELASSDAGSKVFKILDVSLCVCEPTVDAIASLLAAKGELQGFKITSFSTPEDCDRF